MTFRTSRILSVVVIGAVLLACAQGSAQQSAARGLGDSRDVQVRASAVENSRNEGWPRGLVALSVGMPLRLRRDRRLGQGRFGPRFGELMLGAVLSSSEGALQHGVGVGLSIGVSQDGGFYEQVEPFEQYSVSPGYLAMLQVDTDWYGLGHVAIPVAFGGGASLGLDVGVACAYRLLAGLAVFVELSAVTFLGVELRPYPMLAAELGIVVDYEVLP